MLAEQLQGAAAVEQEGGARAAHQLTARQIMRPSSSEPVFVGTAAEAEGNCDGSVSNAREGDMDMSGSREFALLHYQGAPAR
jgi:hypothetical protein